MRKVKEGEVTLRIFGFLTTEPNALVGRYHPKAMPVILRTPEEVDLWMTAPAPEAALLQSAGGDGRGMFGGTEWLITRLRDPAAR